MTRSRVIIVGGGLAGMAAAVRAADAGARIVLLEQRSQLGGATTSFNHGGLTYDNGQHVFMRCCTEYRQFLSRIGSADKVTLQDRMDVPVLRPGRPAARLRRVALPAPAHLAPALARYRPLGLRDRVHAVATGLALRRLDLDDPSLDRLSFGQWLDDHGVSAAEREALWNLVCLPTVNLSAADASLLLAAKVMKTGLLDEAGGADIGWSNVPLQELHADAVLKVLADAGADVRTRVRVNAVYRDADSLTVDFDGGTLEGDAVVVAVPHDAAARLLPAGTFGSQDRVGGLGRSAIVNVHLLYDRPIMHEPFVAAIDSPVQFVFDRTALSGAQAGHQMVAISLSAADTYVSWRRQRLIDFFAAAIGELFPGAAAARLVSSHVTREAAATLHGSPGTAVLRAGPVTATPGVFLAGAWTATGWPATMEGAVRSGTRAASAACAHIAQTTEEKGAAA